MFRFLQNHLQALLKYRSLLKMFKNALWDPKRLQNEFCTWLYQECKRLGSHSAF